MSVHRIAARIAAVEALKGRTMVGNNVLDSRIGAFDVTSDGALRTEEEKLFIVVYTDAGQVKGEDLVQRGLVPNGVTEFLFEAGVATTQTVVDDDGNSVLAPVDIPGTDDVFELYLDAVLRQVSDALTDPTNEWAEIFRKFVDRFESVDRLRTSGDNNGVRLAAHQMKVVASLRTDPVRGVALAPTHPLSLFFAKAEAQGGETLIKCVALLRGLLDADPHAWQLALRRYGLTKGEADAMLITPQEGAEADIEFVEVNSAPATPVSP